ncbi:MAG: YihY/virulence factor BrkB family protein [Bdellovibrionales bacterium]|nr:YihY/virulence factor BrkB family protein [Bdellovibrionales bacterium]
MSAKQIITSFFDKFFKDETTTLAASLAFYTALSLAPLLILFVAISAHLDDHLQAEFLSGAHSLMGGEAAQALGIVIESAKSRADLTSLAGILGASTLLISASLIFGQLRTALNRIFGIQEPPMASGGLAILWQFLRDRLTHIALALIGILCLIISLLASSVLSATLEGGQRDFAYLVNVCASFAFFAAMFTLVFRYLPDRHQPWRQAIQGGILTAALFVVGKELIGLYLGKSAIGSPYGAAGSLIVLLVWVYYSTLITFIGAQVSSLLVRSQSPA